MIKKSNRKSLCYKDRFKVVLLLFILYSVIDKDYKSQFSNMHNYKELLAIIDLKNLAYFLNG